MSMERTLRLRWLVVPLIALGAARAAIAQEVTAPDARSPGSAESEAKAPEARALTLDSVLTECEARPLGPAITGGRILDFAVSRKRPFTIYAASASGGVWRSDNNGTTWSCIFDRALSIGAIATCNDDPDVLWVGTGEGNNQRSSYAGNGVWRTLDGGRTWEHLGLEDSHHIGRIALAPDDHDVAYVAVLGHLYTRNDERGLYKTTDGGKSWERVLGLGDEVGVADVAVDPRDPDTIFAASYDRSRQAWNFEDAGRAAIYRSSDGGTSWRKLAGGLPGGKLGRIGLSIFADDPDVVYACIDNENPRPPDPPKPEDGKEDGAAKPKAPPPDAPPKVCGGEVWRSLDSGATWEKRNEKPVRGEPPYYYGQIRVDPHRKDRVWLLGISLFRSDDGGKSFVSDGVATSVHSDHHAFWIDPVHEGRVLLGNDGGLAQSWDDGRKWDWYENVPVAQFYTVSVDLRRPYRVYGGLQDNGVWMGPSRSRTWGGISRREWSFIGGGDGMYVMADPEEPDVVYLEAQFGSLQRIDLRTSESASIQPKPADEKRPDRYNWCSPLLISHHNSRVVYFGAQCLWRSLDRGDHWKAASPDLSTGDETKVKGNVPHCTITTIAESWLDPDRLLVGTDDGNVQWTNDGGRSWTNLSGRFPRLEDGLWVSRVELSPHDAQSAWVTFSGYRVDDFEPHVYRTRDGGATFTPVTEGLPEGPVNVVHESPRKRDVLFLGSDAGAFYSVDGGDRWQRLARGLPTVSVLDLAVHPREREVVLATHGRGLFAVDVAPHEQIDPKLLGVAAKLFEPSAATRWRNQFGLGDGWSGDRHFTAPNPDAGAVLWYWLKDAPADDAPATLEVLDAGGHRVRALELKKEPGLHRLVWDLRADPPPEKNASGSAAPAKRYFEEGPGESPDAEAEEEERELDLPFAQDSGPRRRRGGSGGAFVEPGVYTLKLTIGTEQQTVPLELEADALRRGL